MANNIQAKIKQIVVEHLGVQESQVTPNAKIIEEFGADSLDAAELVMALEVEFELDIRNTDAAKLVTVEDAEALVRRYLGSEVARYE